MQSIIKKYIERGISVVPEKDQKPLIKGWADFKDTLPTEENLKEWESLNPTGLGLVCGPQSNIIALDLDTDRQDILDEIKHLLPDSPIEKRGSKGWTRFFRYNPAIQNTQVKDGEGKVVIEVLASGKKTTIPPSIHPNGSTYVWTKGKGLLDIDVNTLPLLPPFLMETIELTIRNKFGTTNGPTKGNGRHVTLSSYLGTLIEKPHSVDSILMDLINKDKELHEVPYFSDPNEGYRSTSAINNALSFYTTHLETINSKAYKTNKTYVEPLLHKPEKEVAPVGKPESRLNLKCHEFIPANSVVKRIFDVMMANSWVPQPELALGAILSLGAVLTSRKFIFQGITTNLYISSIANSGAGKNLGLEFVKSTLIELGASSLLGAGDMASDAGITDSLGNSRPVQLYIMDEIGGILNTINNGDMAYNSKMADILAELYTSSTSKYLGRALAEGVKGQSVMPHLSILGATTPTGFRQGVTKSSLDKGLMGRFLLFFGEDSVKSVRVKKKTPLPQDIQVNLQWLLNYKPQEESITIGDIPYKLTELDIDEDADKRMDEIFEELDQIRIENQKENVGPVAARLYQQMVKLVIIHAGLNAEQGIPKICLADVEFGYNVIKTNFLIFKQEIQNLIFSSSFEKAKGEVLTLYKKTDTIKFKDIVRNTPSFAPKFREMVLKDLVDGGILIQEVVGDQRELHYRYIYG